MPRLAWLIALGLLSGCANGGSPRTYLAQNVETMCKHCNCLMPAHIDPEAKCPVCDCGRKAHACVREQ